jgi:hypothetical protein
MNDADVLQLIVQQNARIDTLIIQQNARIDTLVTGLNTRIDTLAGRMDALAIRVQEGFDGVNARLDELHASLAELRQNFETHYHPNGGDTPS